MIPIKPLKELDNIFGRILVESLIAVGANNINTPIRQISKRRKKGTIRNIIENILEKCF